MKKFPKCFLFGSATAAFQIEGGDNFSYWSDWEKIKNILLTSLTLRLVPTVGINTKKTFIY